MAIVNFTKDIEKAKNQIVLIHEWLASPKEFAGNRTKSDHLKDLENCKFMIASYQSYISRVLDAIVELYKREDKNRAVGIPYTKDFNKIRKSLDKLIFSKEDNIIHLRIREYMEPSSYKITVLDNDQLKAERL